MAVAEKVDSRLQLVFVTGFDDISGDVITKTKAFNNVKTDATSEQLLAITDVLVSLQQLPLQTVRRNDTTLLTRA
ncbi:hypothetical protein J2T56_000041 [Natronobacillus azotifigens]|uniref:DUF1659 domain-containing protein n=1 Tax=Natronobacillus azotifigens TaxID=472978 RepID=A0A9J6R7X4_9BACI|nr:DUF1659 domain-containing protein [Natronobacillus azotifigens]MCZ0701746.1 DUF1659 domain-containing protein [Natronobacillus azotifigens]